MKDFIKQNLASVINWALTIGWLVFIGCLWILQGLEKPKTLNELGDFIAGAFAPLAFFWLVRGYYQQGKELKQNTEALRLQADELKNSVEQQKLLQETTRAEFNLIEQQSLEQGNKELILAQPFIHFRRVWSRKEKKSNVQGGMNLNDEFYDSLVIEMVFVNSRSISRELNINIKIEDLLLKSEFYSILENDIKKEYNVGVRLKYPEFFDEKDELILNYEFNYLDAHDSEQCQKFIVKVRRDKMKDAQPTKYERSDRTF